MWRPPRGPSKPPCRWIRQSGGERPGACRPPWPPTRSTAGFTLRWRTWSGSPARPPGHSHRGEQLHEPARALHDHVRRADQFGWGLLRPDGHLDGGRGLKLIKSAERVEVGGVVTRIQTAVYARASEQLPLHLA